MFCSQQFRSIDNTKGQPEVKEIEVISTGGIPEAAFTLTAGLILSPAEKVNNRPRKK
jgi:hypothetical protein